MPNYKKKKIILSLRTVQYAYHAKCVFYTKIIIDFYHIKIKHDSDEYNCFHTKYKNTSIQIIMYKIYF